MRPVYLIILLTVCYIHVNAQDSLLKKSIEIPNKYYSTVEHKADVLNRQLTKRTEKTLNRLSKYEEKMKKRMMKIDSTSARKMFDESQQKFCLLEK